MGNPRVLDSFLRVEVENGSQEMSARLAWAPLCAAWGHGAGDRGRKELPRKARCSSGSDQLSQLQREHLSLGATDPVIHSFPLHLARTSRGPVFGRQGDTGRRRHGLSWGC